MEARTIGITEYRRGDASQTCLPSLLARLRRFTKFKMSAAYLLPLTIAFLTLALATLAYKAKDRRGFGPFFVGLFAAIGILLGKFLWESNAAIYGSVGTLVVASLWNAWPRHEQLDGRPVLAAKDSRNL